MRAEDIRRVAIVGAGTMGHGIGQTFAQAGYPVAFQDISEKNLKEGIDGVRHNLQEMVDLAVYPASEIGPTMARIRGSTSLSDALVGADLVIEAVFEDLELKRRLFAEMDALCPPSTILASNTSSLMPSSLARATKHPERVLVAHYFYPPPLLPLVEVVPHPGTAPEAVDTVIAVLKRMGMEPVLVRKEAVGFIGNRLGFAQIREALYLVEQGIATPEDIDTVSRLSARRAPVAGPFASLEVKATWDLVLSAYRYIVPDLCHSVDDPVILLRKIEKGELGSEVGKGFYDWTPESAAALRHELAKVLVQYMLRRTDPS